MTLQDVPLKSFNIKKKKSTKTTIVSNNELLDILENYTILCFHLTNISVSIRMMIFNNSLGNGNDESDVGNSLVENEINNVDNNMTTRCHQRS